MKTAQPFPQWSDTQIHALLEKQGVSGLDTTKPGWRSAAGGQTLEWILEHEPDCYADVFAQAGARLEAKQLEEALLAVVRFQRTDLIPFLKGHPKWSEEIASNGLYYAASRLDTTLCRALYPYSVQAGALCDRFTDSGQWLSWECLMQAAAWHEDEALIENWKNSGLKMMDFSFLDAVYAEKEALRRQNDAQHNLPLGQSKRYRG